MIRLLMFMAVIVGAVAQAVFPTFRWLGQANAPILLGLVLYYALAHSRGTMLQAAIFAGLLQDALGTIPLGYSSFCFCIVALVVSKFKDMVFAHKLVTHMLFGALASGAVTLALYGLLATAGLVTARSGLDGPEGCRIDVSRRDRLCRLSLNWSRSWIGCLATPKEGLRSGVQGHL